eukprot:419395_1
MFVLISLVGFILLCESNGLNISTTPPERPLPPNLIDIGFEYIAMNWSHPESISSITECVLKADSVTIYRGINTEYNYTNLEPGTAYTFLLICENLCCWSSYAPAVVYTTSTVPHYCDSNADRIWDEIWNPSDTNTNLYTHIDNDNSCILSHDGETNPRYQTDEFCSSDCDVEEASDYFEYIKSTGIKLITAKSASESYVISSNRKYKDDNASPINVTPVLNSNDLDQLCFNESLNHTMGLIWYTQVHWPLGGLENYQSNLQRFYDNGLRIFMIAYGYASNQEIEERLGSGTSEVGGLTDLGKAVVKELNAIGFIIDCSHCNNQTTVETALLSSAPIIANHANVFEVSQSDRTMLDDSIEAIVSKGGVVGIMPLKRFITSHSSATIDDVLQHVQYLVVNYGEDYVGVSTDWYIDNIHEYSTYDYIDKYINSWKRWKYMACFLSTEPYHYSYDRIRKIMGGNFQRVYRQIFDASITTTAVYDTTTQAITTAVYDTTTQAITTAVYDTTTHEYTTEAMNTLPVSSISSTNDEQGKAYRFSCVFVYITSNLMLLI